ncbi:MAG: hypothetical protein P4M12_08115 [Gammaproteobacteria bacterium]|nr:hypothetical protein [Gammaproteobacteria bacterium]
MSSSRPSSATAAYERDLKIAIERSKEEAKRAAQQAKVEEEHVKLALKKSWEDEQARLAGKRYKSSIFLGKRTKQEEDKLNVDEIYNHDVFNSIKI